MNNDTYRHDMLVERDPYGNWNLVMYFLTYADIYADIFCNSDPIAEYYLITYEVGLDQAEIF